MRKLMGTTTGNAVQPSGSKGRSGGTVRPATDRDRDCCDAAGKSAAKPAVAHATPLAICADVGHATRTSQRGAQQPQVVSHQREPLNELAQGCFETRGFDAGIEDGTAANASS